MADAKFDPSADTLLSSMADAKLDSADTLLDLTADATLGSAIDTMLGLKAGTMLGPVRNARLPAKIGRPSQLLEVPDGTQRCNQRLRSSRAEFSSKPHKSSHKSCESLSQVKPGVDHLRKVIHRGPDHVRQSQELRAEHVASLKADYPGNEHDIRFPGEGFYVTLEYLDGCTSVGDSGLDTEIHDMFVCRARLNDLQPEFIKKTLPERDEGVIVKGLRYAYYQ